MTNEAHRQAKKCIEEGDGLPDICHTSVCLEAMRQAGFEIFEEQDKALHDKSWVEPLMPSWNPLTQRFQFNWLGRALLNYGLIVLEFLYLAPKGTVKIQRMLLKGQEGLSYSGQHGTFTPMYLMVGRVPLNKAKSS